MNQNPLFARFSLSSVSSRLRLATLALFLFCGLTLQAAEPLGTGTITGTVGNAGTGNLLEGARVEIPRLRLMALTDNTGQYVLNNVPAGTHEVVVSYTGLDVEHANLTVGAGLRATRDFNLTSNVYVLQAFVVSGEREGTAAAITQRRNADNVKSVVAMDEFGNLPNLNATELAIRLPGVTFGDPGDEVVEQVSVRGMGTGKTVITVDGGLMSQFTAQARTTRMTAFTGAMFESLEVIKGHTPDKGADSLGGTINFKTRSPLSMKEKRRISYNTSIRQAPWFTEQIPLREAHRTHMLFNGAYLEKFRIFGADTDNLAVSVNAFYSENAFGLFESQRDFQQSNTYPGYLFDYRTRDNYNNRMQRSINTKFDFRLSRNSILKLNLIVNDAPEPMRRQYNINAVAGSTTTTPNATTSGVVPGWTDRITVVRANPPTSTASPTDTPTAYIDVVSNLINRNQRLRHADIAGEHTFSSMELDWAGMLSRTRYRTLGAEGTLTNRIGGIPFIGPNGQTGTPTNTIVGPNGERGVGWIMDRTQSDLYPKFIQNGGLDFTDPKNYRPTANGLSTGAGNLQEHLVRDVRANLKYRLPVEAFSAFFKTGGQMRQQTVYLSNRNRRWSYIGVDALPNDPSILMWDRVKTGRNIPIWEGAAFIQNGQPVRPELWQEDNYSREQTRYTSTSHTKETVTAAYAMVQGRIGPNGFLAGVRGENTETIASSFVRNRVLSTTAQRTADPVGAAFNDYGNNWRTRVGTYQKYFPSIHLWRNFSPNLKGRISWSTSFARPSMAEALPNETPNETAQTLTIGNPALQPQTARNWDASAEYYFEPAGSISVGWFHKTIKDYIISGQNVGIVPGGPDNGFFGQYEGFTMLTTSNAGMAITQGWEFSYIQQFRFLPGIWKGLSLNSNLTIIDTHGNFGSNEYRTRDQVSGFIPRTGNVSLSWNYRKFGTRVLYTYTSASLRSYNATQPSRRQYMMKRELVNLGLTYRLRPNLTLQLDIANLFNAPQRYYRGIPDQLQMFRIQGTTISAGVQGQF